MCQGEERPGALGQLGHPLGVRKRPQAASELQLWKFGKTPAPGLYAKRGT